MRSVEWDRREVITRLRRDIWLYVTDACDNEDDIILVAAALLQMQPSEVRFLAQLQFILSEPVGRLLTQMPFLSRRLTTTTADQVEISAERIRGSIRWSATFARRAATGTRPTPPATSSRRSCGTFRARSTLIWSPSPRAAGTLCSGTRR